MTVAVMTVAAMIVPVMAVSVVAVSVAAVAKTAVAFRPSAPSLETLPAGFPVVAVAAGAVVAAFGECWSLRPGARLQDSWVPNPDFDTNSASQD
jgi:hypothetical protein